MDENDEIWFVSDGPRIPTRKTFLKELKIEGNARTYDLAAH